MHQILGGHEICQEPGWLHIIYVRKDKCISTKRETDLGQSSVTYNIHKLINIFNKYHVFHCESTFVIDVLTN